MSEEREWRFRIDDMLGCIDQIQKSVSDHVDMAGFLEDWESFRAVERNFEILAEASKHIPQDIKNRYSHVGWRLMIDMRNFISHRYDEVDEGLIWTTIHQDLPKLKKALIDIQEQK